MTPVVRTRRRPIRLEVKAPVLNADAKVTIVYETTQS